MKAFKTCFSFALAAIALLQAKPSYGQMNTWLSDNFEAGISAYWDKNKTSSNVYTLNDGKSIWGGWLYDPKAELLSQPLFNKVEGLSQLHSIPFSVFAPAESDLIFSMNIWYVALAESQVRNLGVRIRQASNDWDTVYLMKKDGETLPASAIPGKNISVKENLGSKYNGKDSMELQIFYYNASDASDAFFAVVDNVLLASYDTLPRLGLNITSKSYTLKNSITADLILSNLSTEKIAEARYVYAIDDAMTDIDTLKLTFPSGLDINGSYKKSLSIAFENQVGDHKLTIWPISLNTQILPSERIDTIVWNFTYVDETKLTQPIIPIFEEFTSSTCGPCAMFNQVANPIFEEMKGKLNVVKYPVYFPGNGDPYYKPDFGTRFSYYADLLKAQLAVPFPVFNGEKHVNSSWLSNLPKETFKIINNEKALIDLTIKAFSVDSSAQKMTVELEVLPHISTSANLFVNIVENVTSKNKQYNGESEFHYVAMKMATGPKGEMKQLKNGESITLSYDIDMKETNVEEWSDLRVVCYFQEQATGYIFQSAAQSLSGPDPDPGVKNEQAIVSDISLYPNPAVEQVNLSGLNNAAVDIYDIAGHRIASFTGVNDILSVSVADFKAGTYIVRIAENGQVVTKKLTVLK